MNPFILSFRANSINAAIHKHAAFQVVYSHSSPLNSVIGDEINRDIYGFIVRPDVEHACSENISTLSIINVEPLSPAGSWINSLFPEGAKYIPFREKDDVWRTLGIEATENVEEALTAKLNNEDKRSVNSDSRIEEVINYIGQYYARKLTAGELVSLVHLSPSRLSSLFRRQIGSSLSRFILWTRIRQAIHLSLSVKHLTLTEIAFMTGFYDLPQLNKYMYEMIGVPPKVFRDNSDLIQV